MTTTVKKDKKDKVVKDGAVLLNELLQTVLQLDLSRDLNVVKPFLTFFDKLYHAFDGYDLIQKRLTIYKEQVFDIYVFKGTNVRGLYIATIDLINELIPLTINPDKCVLPVKKLTDLVGAVKKYFSEQTDENINNVYHKLTNLTECVVTRVRQSFDKGDVKFCVFLSELQQKLFEALNVASRNSVNTVQFIFDDIIRIFPYFLSYDDLKGYYYL
jgi:hypothetical protein